MKKLILSLILAVTPLCLVAQTATASTQNPQEITIKVQTEQAKVATLEKTVAEKAHEWVSFGEHVGKAIDAGLGSLTEHANKFADTEAGRFTMLIIAWKVAGQDAMTLLERFVGIFTGGPFMVVWFCIYIWYLRKLHKDTTVLIKKKGFFIWGEREYQIIKNQYTSEYRGGATIFATAIFFVVASIIIFNTIV